MDTRCSQTHLGLSYTAVNCHEGDRKLLRGVVKPSSCTPMFMGQIRGFKYVQFYLSFSEYRVAYLVHFYDKKVIRERGCD